jgi:ribosome maturation factor RimP
LLPRLEALLGTEDTTMELTSPGIEHNIKNAAEFAIFVGRNVRVWDKTVTDWVSGKIVSADEKSVELEKEEGERFTVLFENIAKAKFTCN